MELASCFKKMATDIPDQLCLVLYKDELIMTHFSQVNPERLTNFVAEITELLKRSAEGC